MGAFYILFDRKYEDGFERRSRNWFEVGALLDIL
jgi:hypothetical protein